MTTCRHTHRDWCPIADSDLEVADLTTQEIVAATIFSRLRDADCIRCAALSMLHRLTEDEDKHESGYYLVLAAEAGTNDVMMIGEVWEETLNELHEIVYSTRHTCEGEAS